MADEVTTLSILIAIRSQLDGLTQAAAGVTRLSEQTAKASEQGEGLIKVLKDGLGIGTGITIATRGIELLTSTLKESVAAAFQQAAQIKDSSENLVISTEAYQVLGQVWKARGGDAALFSQAVSQSNASLVQARDATSQAAIAYRNLNLSAAALEQLPTERRMEAIGRAILTSKDRTEAYGAASQIVGTRNLPILLGALRDLATQGYDKLSESAKKSGTVMGDETIARLDNAQKAIEKFKQQATIAAGEGLTAASMLKESFGTDFWGTLWAGIKDAGGPYGNLAFKVATTVAPAAPPDKTPEEIENEKALAALLASKLKAQQDLIAAENTLTGIEIRRQEIEADPIMDEVQKRKALAKVLLEEGQARNVLARAMIASPDAKLTPEQRALALAKLDAGTSTIFKQQAVDLVPKTASQRSREGAERYNNPDYNTNAMTAGQGVAAGAENYIAGLGSQGEQVAATIKGTIGDAVSGISDGIYGWITGTESFGAAMMNLGATVFKSILQTLVQMGVQWLINTVLIKTGMIGIEATGDALRAGRVVKENAATAATLPLKTADAAATGIGSYGVALAFGALAIALVLGAMAMFSSGGYTGPGGVNEPRGITHAGEIVWSQADIARAGGVTAVESARVNGGGLLGMSDLPGQPSALSSVSVSSSRSVMDSGNSLAPAAGAAARGAGTSSSPQPVAVFDNRDSMRTWVEDRGGDAVIAETANQNSYRIRQRR